MNSRRTIHWLLILATAVVVQAVTSTVQASCGDYLIGQAERHAASPDPASKSDSLPVPERIPCNGPGCQKAPADPISPAPAKASVPDHERLGCLSGETPIPQAKQILRNTECREPLSDGNPQGIEHPPRA